MEVRPSLIHMRVASPPSVSPISYPWLEPRLARIPRRRRSTREIFSSRAISTPLRRNPSARRPRGTRPECSRWYHAPVLMALLLVVVVVGFILVVRAAQLTEFAAWAPADSRALMPVAPPAQVPVPTGGPSATALTIVEERFTRGELDRDEFLQRRHDLLSPLGRPGEAPPLWEGPPSQSCPQ